MTKRITLLIFLISLMVALLLLLLIHGIEWEIILTDELNRFVSETIMYLTGLSALYFGWRLIDHKFPSKDES